MEDSREKQIDDIVSMLDRFMTGDGGHMNIRVSEDGTVNTEETMKKSVTTMKSSDCSEGDVACRIPNLTEGLDDSL